MNTYRARAAAACLALALTLGACSKEKEPTLLEASDIEGAVLADYDPPWPLEGGTWCMRLEITVGHDDSGSILFLDDEERSRVAAAVVSSPYVTAQDEMNQATGRAASCAWHTADNPEILIEPLDLADSDALGWRTTRGEPGIGEYQEGLWYVQQEGFWGEYAIVKLDDHRVLAVGFETDQPHAPIDIDDLMQLARERAAQLELEP